MIAEIYLESEVKKMYQSFIDYLKDRHIPICNLQDHIYLPKSVNVEFHAHEIKSYIK